MLNVNAMPACGYFPFVRYLGNKGKLIKKEICILGFTDCESSCYCETRKKEDCKYRMIDYRWREDEEREENKIE